MLLHSSNLVSPMPLWLDDSVFANAYAPLKADELVANHGGNVVSASSFIDSKISQILALPAGWDGPGSVPISRSLANKAKRAIKLVHELAFFQPDPAIVPCADGSIQIEWHLTDGRFEMYFETDGSVGAWWHDHTSDVQFEEEADAAFGLLAQWAVRDAAWQVQAIAA